MNEVITTESLPSIMDELFLPDVMRTRDEWREKIFQLQECLLQFDEKLEIPPTNRFCDGVYARELFLPKGSLIVGKIHRHAHHNILSCGAVTVVTEDGVESFAAPHAFISKPGTKRVVYAHEDSVWTTIHPTAETDVDKIEAQIICQDYSELELIGHAATAAIGVIA